MSLKIYNDENFMNIANVLRLKTTSNKTYRIADFPQNLIIIFQYLQKYIEGDLQNYDFLLLNPNITHIGLNAFLDCTNLALTELPENLTNIEFYAFKNCTNLKTLTFKGTPQHIGSYAFEGCENLTTINVPWSEEEVSYAPWGAINATINYNSTVVN